MLALALAFAALGAPGLAAAGALYINGVRADTLRNMDLKDVDVRIDGDGNIWIDAPRYAVEVVSPGDPLPPAGQTQPGAPAGAQTAPVPAPVGPASAAAALPAGTWWLVSEDNASTGHIVDVYVNGVLVTTLRSGDPQLLLDVSRYLHRGVNQVLFTARPGQPGGGLMQLYLGSGTNDSGTLNLNTPDITFTRRSSDPATGSSRQFELTVP